MFLYLILGFLLGMLIPFMTGRFGKLIPMDPGLLLLKMFHRPHFPKTKDFARQCLLRRKWKKLITFSFLWGIVCSALFCFSYVVLPTDFCVWACVFCWIISISMCIDAQYWLLPDFFTIPFLLLGIAFSFYHSEIGTQAGLFGSGFADFISVVSVFVMGCFSQNPQFGGGDVKMLTALGAWLGILGINYALILSFLFFVLLNTLPIQKKGAYGPALGTAALFVFFLIYVK